MDDLNRAELCAINAIAAEEKHFLEEAVLHSIHCKDGGVVFPNPLG